MPNVRWNSLLPGYAASSGDALPSPRLRDVGRSASRCAVRPSGPFLRLSSGSVRYGGGSLPRARASFLAALALLAVGTAAAAGLPAPVQDALQRHRLPEGSLSVWVQDVAAEAPLLSHRPDVSRHPASTIKLLTTFAALQELGPAYEWETGAYVTGPVRGGRLEGDLVLVGGGDPYLVVERLWRLLAAVRARGLREIGGRIVIDNTRFSVAGEPPPGAFDGKPHRAYNALPDALLVNFNALDLVLEARGGGDVRIRTDPPVTGLRLRTRLDFVRGGCSRGRLRMDVSKPLSVGSHLSAPLPLVTLSGRFPRNCPRWTFRRSLLPPARFAHGVIRALWTQMGGEVEGGLALGRLPAGAVRWSRHHSPPLSYVVKGVNKFSNNVMARNLLLTLGAERFGPPGTVDKGRRAVAARLREEGIDLPHLRIANGSGLSRETRISSRGLAKVLLAAERSPFRPEFAQSLPIASLDGTMRRRLRRDPEAERARIKTGLLDGVRAMAGYVRTRDGSVLAVAAVQNHPGVHLGGRGTAVQDALLRWLLDR